MEVAITLAVVAAACIGTADFLGGVVGRRDASNSALIAVYLAVLTVSLPVAAAVDGWPEADGMGWGAGMGVLWVIGIFALVRGVAHGRVVVVIPIAGVLSAIIPVAVDLIAGQTLDVVVEAGVAAGIVAIGLVGLGPGSDGERSVSWSALQGTIGGISTGFSLVMMRQAAESGLWPLVTVGLVAAVLTAIVLAVMGSLQRPSADALLPAVMMGLLVAGSFVAMMFAFPRGSLTVVAVIVAQYPVATLLLAALVWRQPPRGIQYLGVGLTLLAVGLIAAGA